MFSQRSILSYMQIIYYCYHSEVYLFSQFEVRHLLSFQRLFRIIFALLLHAYAPVYANWFFPSVILSPALTPSIRVPVLISHATSGQFLLIFDLSVKF